MIRQIITLTIFIFTVVNLTQCKKNDSTTGKSYPQITAAFGGNIDPDNLLNYASQSRPAYILKDNTGNNPITDLKATLGRILFYDKTLSIDNSISCGSCHKQSNAFGDDVLISKGVLGGETARHAMRLVNARFATENKFFWDERAISLEAQTTQPIQEHVEMGYSGQAGRPDINSLLIKMKTTGYYREMFQLVYGDQNFTEARLQECLAQFVRSIESFDSKYDAGRSLVNNDNANFPNFSLQENAGKGLFMQPPVFNATGMRIAGGVGCNACHNAPEFDIAPNSRNNGIIGRLNATGLDLLNTRSPTLRDLTNPAGSLNTALMHTGIFTDLQTVIGHYGNINIAPGNNNLDPRLRPNGFGQQLQLTAAEVNSLQAFLRTLSGNNVYSDKKWSNPFL